MRNLAEDAGAKLSEGFMSLGKGLAKGAMTPLHLPNPAFSYSRIDGPIIGSLSA